MIDVVTLRPQSFSIPNRMSCNQSDGYLIQPSAVTGDGCRLYVFDSSDHNVARFGYFIQEHFPSHNVESHKTDVPPGADESIAQCIRFWDAAAALACREPACRMLNSIPHAMDRTSLLRPQITLCISMPTRPSGPSDEPRGSKDLAAKDALPNGIVYVKIEKSDDVPEGRGVQIQERCPGPWPAADGEPYRLTALDGTEHQLYDPVFGSISATLSTGRFRAETDRMGDSGPQPALSMSGCEIFAWEQAQGGLVSAHDLDAAVLRGLSRFAADLRIADIRSNIEQLSSALKSGVSLNGEPLSDLVGCTDRHGNVSVVDALFRAIWSTFE